MPLTRIKTKGLGTSVTFENITDTGTEGTKVAVGTTAQRGSTTGQWRYNTDTGFFEGRNTSGDFSTLEPTPTVSSVDVTEVDSQAGGNQTIVITGTNFTSGATASFVGTSATFNASTTTIDSATQITAVAPKASFLNAQEPYKVRVTSSSGVAGTSSTGLINVDNAPTWTTASGSLGSIQEDATGNHFTVAASDAEGDTIAYSLQSGSLAGLSLDSSTGVISGDPDNVGSDTTNSFTLRATANSKTADRAFSYITKNLNTQALLFDATNMSSNASGIPTANGQGLGSVSPSTAVTFSNVNAEIGNYEKGKNLFDKKKYDLAKFKFEKDLVFNPKSESSYLYLSKIFNKQDKKKLEEQNLNTVILLNPKNEEAIYNLAKLKLLSSDFQKSRELNKRLKLICRIFCLQSDKLKIEIENLSKK